MGTDPKKPAPRLNVPEYGVIARADRPHLFLFRGYWTVTRRDYRQPHAPDSGLWILAYKFANRLNDKRRNP